VTDFSSGGKSGKKTIKIRAFFPKNDGDEWKLEM